MRNPAATSSGAGAVCALGVAPPIREAAHTSNTPARTARRIITTILSRTPELGHRTVDLAPCSVHAAERRVCHQAMPRIEHHLLAALLALGVIEALPRNPDGGHSMVGRIARLPLDGRILNRRSLIV